MKVGLVLEGGALRAVFSSGVCDGLLKGDVMTDYVIGVSAGIAYGVSYASKQYGRNLEVVTQYVRDKRYMGMHHLRDKNNRSYFGLDFLYDKIPNELVPFDYDAFEAFPGQVEAVVTNLETGKAEYKPVPRRDKQSTLIQASCAMMLVFPIYEIEGNSYLDGGAADAIPYRRAFEQGCDKVIVVLTKPRDYVREEEKSMPLIRKKYQEFPNFCQTMEDRADQYNADRAELFRLEKEGKALVFAPESTHGVGRIERDVDKLRMLWGDGLQQVADRLDEVRDFIRQ